MAQTTLNYLQNRNLFSTHYLESLINDNPEWNEDVKDAFNRAKKLYNNRKDWGRMDESSLEEFLIRPLLRDILGHHFVPQAKVEQGSKRPDYAFFENEADVTEAFEKKGIEDFYKKAIAVGDAKSWKTSLDKKVKGAKGSFEYQNPSYQIDEYLRRTPVLWGILTNGRFWRIYHRETSYKLDSYYEIDLVTILETNDVEGFKYFYLFFRLNALIKDASGKNFLERVKEGSIAYATKLRENLQKNVYEAMKVLSEGFFEWKDNALSKNEHDIREVQENTLKLLYRLLFIFYAESLRLLDRDNPEYKKLSLLSIKYDIANKIEKKELILPVTTDYWNKLNTLFALINEGSESENFRIAKDILYIPAYNGGLFDPKRNPFLQNKRIGDVFIAKAIDLLAREGKDFIDYSTLGTRQLGSIYEGLLEYKLKVAEEELVAVKEKGHERWISKKEAQGKKTFDEIKAGAIYLATDKGERKATGSYYTPDYIVKYIVRNTLLPILDEKRAAWKEKGLGERPFLHDILGIRVLDPAMGSGHFLVEACEFLANRLVEAWGEAKPEELESEEVAEHDVHWARREVVRHCIFGVDLNPMAVELAKLSLWLETVAANKPLTFLDHHLKVGNSLIGAQVRDLKTLPSKEKKEGAEGKKQLKAPTLWDFTVKKHFEELLVKYGEFAAHPDDDLKSVKQKEQEYDALQKSELNRRLHELANIWVSTYFGAAPPPDEYAEMQNEMNPKDFPDWSKWRGREWFAEAQRLAGEKRFFHWELEFPESFYEKGAPKEAPGWDAVVGNPPYGYRMIPSPEEKIYYETFYKTHQYDYEFYIYFSELGHHLAHSKGCFGMILPNTFLTGINFSKIRQMLLKECTIHELHYIGLGIFEGVTVENVLLFSSPKYTADNKILVKLSPNTAINQSLNGDEVHYVSQDYFSDSINIGAHGKRESIVKKMDGFGDSLENLAYVTVGINTGYIRDQLVAAIKKDDRYHKMVSGKDISRYSFEWPGEWICYDPKLVASYEKLGRTLPPEYIFTKPKLLIQRTRRGLDVKLVATYDADQFYNLNRLSNVVVNDGEKISFFYLLSLMNSRLLDRYFNWVFNEYEVKPAHLRKLPIRRISFTTPPDRRAALVDEAKALCSAFVGAPGAEDLDRINRMDRIHSTTNPVNPVHPVQTVASLSTAPDSQKILDFISERLSAEPEESDVVHDLLAHLAERMIEMNKEKNAEIKGFLRWLEGEIGAPVEELTNKTALKEYYDPVYSFESLVGALAKNKKKLKEGYDPTRREPKDKLRDEFNASVGKLAPRLRRIEATDGLIDAIVYRLYGLSEDEIKIVEGSISGENNAEGSKT